MAFAYKHIIFRVCFFDVLLCDSCITRYILRALAVFTLFVSFSITAIAGSTKPFDCTNDQCGLISDGSYNNFVVGVVEAVASLGASTKIFNWAKKITGGIICPRKVKGLTKA